MPRTDINYSNTIIYKLCCKDLSITDIYIGQTTDMRKRKNLHKSTCYNDSNNKYNYYVYKFIRENGGWDNWDMIEVERFKAIDGDDARKKERYWIEQLRATLNSAIPGRTQKEYDEIHKEHLEEKRKEWYEENKEILLKYRKEYYMNNKDIINEIKKIKIKCECGCEVSKQCLNKHIKSKKHIDLMS